MTQYVSIQFNPWDRRTYCYHNDGPDAAIGDEVEVDTPLEGIKRVVVVSVTTAKPEFLTRPIVRIVPDGGAA